MWQGESIEAVILGIAVTERDKVSPGADSGEFGGGGD